MLDFAHFFEDKILRRNLKMKRKKMTSPFELPTFNGYTVDIRLKQFRKVEYGENPQIEFIDFDSEKGQELLLEMQEYFSSLFEEY